MPSVYFSVPGHASFAREHAFDKSCRVYRILSARRSPKTQSLKPKPYLHSGIAFASGIYQTHEEYVVMPPSTLGRPPCCAIDQQDVTNLMNPCMLLRFISDCHSECCMLFCATACFRDQSHLLRHCVCIRNIHGVITMVFWVAVVGARPDTRVDEVCSRMD